jgi:hypothetical protein
MIALSEIIQKIDERIEALKKSHAWNKLTYSHMEYIEHRELQARANELLVLKSNLEVIYETKLKG